METELEEKNKKKNKEVHERKEGEIMPLIFDECFKIMFANQSHLETLTFLISKVLGIKYEKLKGNITLQPDKYPKAEIGKKQEERDLVVSVASLNDTKIMIEVNYNPNAFDKLGEYFLDDNQGYVIKLLRDLYYAAALVGNSLDSGEGYNKLSALFLIEFNHYFVDKDHKEFFEEYHLRNKYGHILTKKFKIINLNVVECRNMWYDKTYQNIEYNDYERNLIALGALISINNLEDIEKCLKEVDTTLKIKKLFKEVIVNMNKDEERWGRFYNFQDEQKKINDSTLAYSKEEGIEEGKEIGLIEGRKEREQEMVINFYNQEVPIEVISKASGLSQEEVEEIINNSKNK